MIKIGINELNMLMGCIICIICRELQLGNPSVLYNSYSLMNDIAMDLL